MGGCCPIVMAFGTIALMLAEFTSIFVILGKPFEPILTVLGLPEAAEAANNGRWLCRYVSTFYFRCRD